MFDFITRFSFKLPRLFGLLLLNVVLICIVLAFSPQLPVTLYKLSLVTLAGFAGYWLDRALFPYARPDDFVVYLQEVSTFSPDNHYQKVRVKSDYQWAFCVSMLRRAIVVGAAMLSLGLGA